MVELTQPPVIWDIWECLEELDSKIDKVLAALDGIKAAQEKP